MQDTKTKKEELLKTLGIVIKKYRGDKSISQLSNEIDLSKSIWSKLEKGEKDVQFSTLWRIAEAMSIKISDLLNEIESELGENFSLID